MADSQVGDGARRCFRAGEGDCCVEELGDGDVGGGGGEVPRGGEKRRVPFIFLLFSIYILPPSHYRTDTWIHMCL